MIDYGHGVKLGPLDACDLESIRKWRNDPKIMKWCRQSTVISSQEQADWYAKQKSDPSIQMFAIYDTDASEHYAGCVGVAGLTSIDRLNSRAEFSLYVAPMQQGCGRGRRALKTLLDHAFKDLNLNQVWGESFEGNPAIKMFSSLGFQTDGVRRYFYFKGGKYVNAHLVSILKGEWESRRHEAK